MKKPRPRFLFGFSPSAFMKFLYFLRKIQLVGIRKMIAIYQKRRLHTFCILYYGSFQYFDFNVFLLLYCFIQCHTKTTNLINIFILNAHSFMQERMIVECNFIFWSHRWKVRYFQRIIILCHFTFSVIPVFEC